MSGHIAQIGNHNLDTSCLKSLAHDLAKRFNVNVEYGYNGDREYFIMLGEFKDDCYVKVGSVRNISSDVWLTLIDETYQEKLLYQRFGEDILKVPEFYYYYNQLSPEDKQNLIDERDFLWPQYELNVISNGNPEFLLIYHELFCNDILYFSKWQVMCDLFMKKCYQTDYYFSDFIQHRKGLLDYLTLLGGDKMYYFDSVTKSFAGVGHGDENSMSWKEFEEFVIQKSSTLLLNIPRFLTDNQYKNEFMLNGIAPLCLVDDFSDLK